MLALSVQSSNTLRPVPETPPFCTSGFGVTSGNSTGNTGPILNGFMGGVMGKLVWGETLYVASLLLFRDCIQVPQTCWSIYIYIETYIYIYM